MVFNIISYLICTVSGLLFIKLGSKDTELIVKNHAISMNISLLIVLGLLFYIASFLLWIKILKNNDLGYIVALTTGLSQVLIISVSAIFLDERITMFKGLGIAVTLVGVVLINLGK